MNLEFQSLGLRKHPWVGLELMLYGVRPKPYTVWSIRLLQASAFMPGLIDKKSIFVL